MEIHNWLEGINVSQAMNWSLFHHWRIYLYMVTELSKQNELSDNKFESKWSIESEMIFLLVLVPLDKEEDRKPLAFTALKL